jgi:hypothetical protein
MSRHLLILLPGTVACALVAVASSGASLLAGAVGAQQAALTCPPNPRMGMACELKGSDATLASNGRVLRLRVPANYRAMQVTCRKDSQQLVTCTISRIAVGTGTGTRVVAVPVPATWGRLQINCASIVATRGVACRVVKHVGVGTVGG